MTRYTRVASQRGHVVRAARYSVGWDLDDAYRVVPGRSTARK